LQEYRRWKIATFTKVYMNIGRNIVRLASRVQTSGKVIIILKDYKNQERLQESRKITRIKKEEYCIVRLQENYNLGR